MIKELNIKNEGQIRRINQIASQAPYEVWLNSGTVMLDARSLLGLFALVGKRANVVVEDDVAPRAFSKLTAQMA